MVLHNQAAAQIVKLLQPSILSSVYLVRGPACQAVFFSSYPELFAASSSIDSSKVRSHHLQALDELFIRGESNSTSSIKMQFSLVSALSVMNM